MAYPLISLGEIITAAFIRIDTEDSRDELVFQEWAWDAIREIGPTRVDKKTVCLDVNDFCIAKPHDFLYALELNLLDANNNIYYYQSTESGFQESDQANKIRSTSASIMLTETKYNFELSSNANQISKAELTYYHYPINDEGDLLVEEKLKEAILSFIEFMWVKRQRRRKGGRDIPLSEVQYTEDVWRRKRQEVRGDIKMPDPMAAETIFKKWVTGIPNFKRRHRKARPNGYYRGFY